MPWPFGSDFGAVNHGLGVEGAVKPVTSETFVRFTEGGLLNALLEVYVRKMKEKDQGGAELVRTKLGVLGTRCKRFGVRRITPECLFPSLACPACTGFGRVQTTLVRGIGTSLFDCNRLE